ncbi:Photosystem I assembly protein Ycf3 [Planctomycetes bacterium K2D]|uniref:Photosystem I assembly protein Ycf3 n=2 Tax=Botrimarina mediterranea TaxID=2528022 RepID=A0A518K4F9_9BACT|nr:Photosystem I assembly protein Ycf3 [Botrimarina mediterranea]QDV77242.1 Photosystem I assembly protein Ycf3 [Planctomycetes bacterium K2D]
MLVAEALSDLARYEEAEQAYAKALEHMSDDGKRLALAGLGHLFRAAGDYEQAASWYRKAIDAAPNNAGYPIYLGAVLAKQGRLHEAEEAHRTALTCDEGDISEAYWNLGSVLRSRDRFADAAECFRAALLLDPDYAEAKAALDDVLGCY